MLLCVYIKIFYALEASQMRTNIVIDDSLMSEALKRTGLKTKKEAVEQGLRLLVKRNKQQDLRKLRGKLNWEGDLNEMRGG
jgi:Arc/MetJ family transcription regulator